MVSGAVTRRTSLDSSTCANRYFRHYKMYQYAFMPTFILNIETLETANFVELPPYVYPLRTYMPQEEYDEELELIRKAKEVCHALSIPTLMMNN